MRLVNLTEHHVVVYDGSDGDEPRRTLGSWAPSGGMARRRGRLTGLRRGDGAPGLRSFAAALDRPDVYSPFGEVRGTRRSDHRVPRPGRFDAEAGT